MNKELMERVQLNMAKIDKLKVAKIEAETKLKSLQESLAKDLESAKELGYNSLDEMVSAQTILEADIKKECEEVEKAFLEAGV